MRQPGAGAGSPCGRRQSNFRGPSVSSDSGSISIGEPPCATPERGRSGDRSSMPQRQVTSYEITPARRLAPPAARAQERRRRVARRRRGEEAAGRQPRGNNNISSLLLFWALPGCAPRRVRRASHPTRARRYWRDWPAGAPRCATTGSPAIVVWEQQKAQSGKKKRPTLLTLQRRQPAIARRFLYGLHASARLCPSAAGHGLRLLSGLLLGQEVARLHLDPDAQHNSGG